MIPKLYRDLFIYYLEGRLKADEYLFGENFIGNWEEDNFSFLFFSNPARNDIEKLLRTQPQLTYIDTYHMTYDQWQSQTFTTARYGKFCIIPPWEASAFQPLQRGDEVPILLDPGVVFGTGTHPTTRSCLEALELAAAQVEAGETWPDLLDAFRQGMAELAAQDLDEAEFRYESLRRSFRPSLDRLSLEDLAAFTWLGVLPEDARLNPAMAAILWGEPERAARSRRSRLRDKALLMPDFRGLAMVEKEVSAVRQLIIPAVRRTTP